MKLEGFTPDDFNVFQIEGLHERMKAIQERIQPKFKTIGESLRHDLSILLGQELYLHIAKHARRTVNPPKDTWLAICDNKRGYKKHPHFQLGLFDDRIFIWFALIYELPNKAAIANAYINEMESLFANVPENYVIAQDHMKKDADKISELSFDDLRAKLERFRTVKKAEWLIGKHIDCDDSIVQDGEMLYNVTFETFKQLLPFYHVAMRIRNENV